jgi:phage terminase large subunit-like protein
VSTPAQDRYAISKGCYFDDAAADRVRRFFRLLRHSKGKHFVGKPFELLDWQWEQIVRPLFGWKRADGTRRFRRAYVEVPKKNGKSTLCAGLALYLAIADNEPGAQVYIAAADRRQASIVYNEANAMRRRSPAIANRIVAVPSRKRLDDPQTDSFIEALSNEAATKEGFDIHGLIFDELHAQKTAALWDALKYGGAARDQPLFISITTAGFDRQSVCYQQHLYAKEILNDISFDEAFFAFIAAADPDDDPWSETTWRKANPSFGTTIKADTFAEDARQAEKSPVTQNSFKRYRLNLWTSQQTLAIPMTTWDAAPLSDPIPLDDLDGEECYCGIDLASTMDLNALALYFPHVHALLPWFWVPQEACPERERLLKTRLEPWIDEGLITVVPGSYMEYEPVKETLDALAKRYKIKHVGVDRWNATQFTASLKKTYDVTFYGQGFPSYNAATKHFLGLVGNRKLRHGGHPVLRWNANNLAVEENAGGDLRPAKNKSADKIDGITASIMAVGVSLTPEQKGTVYNKRGIIEI